MIRHGQLEDRFTDDAAWRGAVADEPATGPIRGRREIAVWLAGLFRADLAPAPGTSHLAELFGRFDVPFCHGVLAGRAGTP
jgi:hypothetical protein